MEATSTIGRLESAVRRNPYGMCAVAIGERALVGIAIPLSKAENEVMGEMRDSLLDSAQEALSEATERATRVAEEAKTAVVDKASEEGLVVKKSPQKKAPKSSER